MANFERHNDYPHVLLVWGEDVHEEGMRGKVRDYLYGQSDSPVSRGTHDFMVMYAEPSLGEGEWCCEDMDESPRKMRGLVRMGALPGSIPTQTLQDQLNVLMQEICHHWLVPAELGYRRWFEIDFGFWKIKFPLPYQRMLTGIEMTRQINADEGFSAPPLLARDNTHWSAYMSADASPMDGMYYEPQPDETGYKVWKQAPYFGETLAPEGLSNLQLLHSLSDLDLTIMGVMRAVDAYPDNDGKFKWMTPKLTAPLSYHSGLFVAFSQYDHIQFGFYRDHRILVVARTGGNNTEVDLSDVFQPLGHDLNSVALRVIKQGNDYHFQAKLDNPLRGCALGLLRALRRDDRRIPQMFDGVDNPQQPDANESWTDWKTVATVQSRETPKAIGMFGKKWEHPFLCDTAFINFSVFKDGETNHIQSNSLPELWVNDGTYSDLPEDSLVREEPSPGAIIRQKGGWLHIITPFSAVDETTNELTHYEHDHFNHGTSVDNCPKVLMAPPSGDFAFGALARVHRTIFTPWAGGFAADKTMWGKVSEMPVSDIVIPPHITAKHPTPPVPVNVSYKIAFIMVAKNRSDISDDMIERLDIIRRYWDQSFRLLTNRRYISISQLE